MLKQVRVAMSVALLVSGLALGGCLPDSVRIQSSIPPSEDGLVHVSLDALATFSIACEGVPTWTVSGEIASRGDRTDPRQLDWKFSKPGSVVIRVTFTDLFGRQSDDSITVIVGEEDNNHQNECWPDHSCGVGKHCEDGKCVDDAPPPPECDTGHPCGDGKHCEGGKCVNDPPSTAWVRVQVKADLDPDEKFSDGPLYIRAGADNTAVVTMKWNSDGMTSLIASDAWTGSKTIAVGRQSLLLEGASGVRKTYVAVLTGHRDGVAVDSDAITIHVEPFVSENPPEPKLLTFEFTAPAMDSEVCVGDLVSFTIHITGDPPPGPYVAKVFLTNGNILSVTSSSTTITLTTKFLYRTPGDFPVDQYGQVTAFGGEVSPMGVVRLKVVGSAP